MFDLLPADVMARISDTLNVLTDRGIWVRVGTVVAGLALMLIGILMLLRNQVPSIAKAVL